jgi:hypothetical protein
MIILILIGLLILVFACWMWIRLVTVIFNKVFSKKPSFKNELDNPYIIEQKARMKNDADYAEYQKWHSKHGDGMLIEKVVTEDDRIASEKLRKYFAD